MKTYTLMQDKDGAIRFPHDVEVSAAAVNDIIETMWVKNSTNMKLEKLDISFDEYDVKHGIKSSGPGRRWTTEEEQHVLLHHEEDDTACGSAIGRTGMSVHMKKAKILSLFDTWRQQNTEKIVGLTREQIVSKYLYGDKDNE